MKTNFTWGHLRLQAYLTHFGLDGGAPKLQQARQLFDGALPHQRDLVIGGGDVEQAVLQLVAGLRRGELEARGQQAAAGLPGGAVELFCRPKLETSDFRGSKGRRHGKLTVKYAANQLQTTALNQTGRH